jgi:hypothetical protein
MRYVLAGLALLLIIGGIIVGVSVNNSNNQHNAQATATAQANQQAQATIDAQSTIDAQATQNAQNVQATQSAQPTIPNVQGSYSGTYQASTSSTTSPMSLTISQQNQQSWTGSCTLQGTSGSSNFNITNGTVDQNGNITFSISGVDGSGNNVTVSFTSTQPNSPTGWTGSYSVSNGASGSWNVS